MQLFIKAVKSYFLIFVKRLTKEKHSFVNVWGAEGRKNIQYFTFEIDRKKGTF